MNHREPGEFGDGATILQTSTPAIETVSASTLRHMLYKLGSPSPDLAVSFRTDELHSIITELISRRSLDSADGVVLRKALEGVRANLIRLAWEENSVMIEGIDKALASSPPIPPQTKTHHPTIPRQDH